MKAFSTVMITLVGIFHVGFLILESFLWDTPTGKKIFHMTDQAAAATKVLAMNQGLYNGFLAAGLFWGAVSGDAKISTFFLVCVIVAGIVGALTASKNIIYVQALPAVIALVALYLSNKA